MKTFLPFRCLGLIPVLSVHLLGQAGPSEPLELRQSSAPVNVSVVPDAVPSSSGSKSTGKHQPTKTPKGAAPRQYGSVMSFGGGIRIAGSPTNPPPLDASRSLVDNAVSLNLPRLGGANPTHVLLRSRIGSPVSSGPADGSIKVISDLKASPVVVSSPK